MSVLPNSFRDYIANGGQTVFPIVIDRISDTHIRVFQNGAVLTLITDYTILGANVTLAVGANAGDKLRIQRDTPQLTRSVDFMAGGSIVESDLDNSALHNLYLAQECWDQVLQRRDNPIVVVNWAPATLNVDVANYEADVANRLTPSLGVEVKSQQYIEVDVAAKSVTLSPGAYRIDIQGYFEDQNAGVSRLSAAVCDEEASILFALATAAVVDISFYPVATYLVNLTAETVYNFKAAVTTAGGDIDVKAPCQWIIERLGGDPELN